MVDSTVVGNVVRDVLADQAKDDKLFLTEIMNDLHRKGFVRGGKAEQMLRDWSKELRRNARPKLQSSKLKKTFCKEVGANLW